MGVLSLRFDDNIPESSERKEQKGKRCASPSLSWAQKEGSENTSAPMLSSLSVRNPTSEHCDKVVSHCTKHASNQF